MGSPELLKSLTPAPGMPWWNQLGIPIALIAVSGVLLHVVPTFSIGIVVLFLAVYLAYHSPRITIAAIILLGQVLQFEIAPLFGISPEGLDLGAAKVRLSDPLILGVAVTVGIRLLARDLSLMRLMRREGALLFSFLLYLLVHVVANVGTYGISAPGEFRTYFQFLLLVPYAVVSTKTEKERKAVFLILVVLSLSQLLWGGMRGIVIYSMTFSAYDKWLSGFGSLALLYGIVAYAAACREHLVTQGSIRRYSLYIASLGMIVIAGARAVWFSGVCILLFLALRTRFSARNVVKGAVLVFLAGVVIYPIFLEAGLAPVEFLSERMLAFTDFTSDPTAAWRYTYWLASLEEVFKRPWLGHGFGLHFNVYVPQFGEIITTSPHNLYLSILYQSGIIGLLLYLIWIVQLFVRMMKSRVSGNADRAILGTALLVLVSVHAYGVAYAFEKDFFTWTYVGLGISSMIHSGNNPSTLHAGNS